MTKSELPVAIIGAGIGGLAAATALRAQGVAVQVYEQARQFARIGAGIQMSPNAMRVLDGLGLRPQLEEIAFSPKSSLNRAHDTGAVTNEFPLAGAVLERYGMPFLAMHRGDLHAALAAQVPQAQISLGKKLVHLDQGDREVALRFEDGTEARARAVIGADGVHSLVRELLLGEEQPRFTGRVAYRTTFPASRLGALDIGQSRTKWWGPDRHIVIYYVTRRQDEIYFVTSQPEDAGWLTPESWSAKGDLDVLRAAYADFHPDVRAVLAACPDVHKWAIFQRDPLPSWGRGNVVLMGDACHPMTPYMAQGAAMALEDSVVLARCVAAHGSDLDAAFRLFEQVRKPRTSAVQAGSSANNWMRESTNPDWVYGYDAWNVPLEANGQ
ncbi:salicylate 1-monooxygenase [Pigmentiphaga sp. H8]|uniref:FAD-dependent monooxygenase n=1 Tax=Pigmentiphaga sp. H8 TaxID=2488560 RepID=UPI000F5B1EEB|nr:FAD-dependent monooxygenase [Pigmentiphaga sp. H8]AZG07193.1 salicylate 1-monooxygenase [Pigmentiphaga sp. H8]